MSTVEFIDHLTTIFADLVVPAIGVWIAYLLRSHFGGNGSPKK